MKSLQYLIDKHEAEHLPLYEREFSRVDMEARRRAEEGDIESLYKLLLERKELREKIEHAKICLMRSKAVR